MGEIFPLVFDVCQGWWGGCAVSRWVGRKVDRLEGKKMDGWKL